MVLFWRPDLSGDELVPAIVEELHTSKRGTYSGFGIGRSKAQDWQQSTVSVEGYSELPDYFSASGLFIVSARMKEAIEQYHVVCEFLPVRIRLDGQLAPHLKFFCCNIMDVVDCVDRVKSDCEFWDRPGFEDHIRRFKHLVLDNSRTDGHHFFCIGKGLEYLVCVSENLAATITELHLTGVEFVRVEDWW